MGTPARHSGEECFFDAGAEEAFGSDAAAALDDEAVVGQVVREVVAGGDGNLQVSADFLAEEIRDFYTADIFCIRHMRAGFGDEDTVAGLEGADGFGTIHEGADVALGAGEEDGEAREGVARRKDGIDLGEGLGVGDREGRRGAEAVEGAPEPVGLAADGDAAEVEEFAEDLDLRQDQAAFRGLAVLRHDEDDDIVFADKAAGEEALLAVGADGLEASEEVRNDIFNGCFPCARLKFNHRDLGRLQHFDPMVVLTARLRRSRSAPSAPGSPKPAVSTRMQGPSSGSSMAFRTGSVVVPGNSLTSETSCPARAFTSVDLPLFVAPKKAICSRSISETEVPFAVLDALQPLDGDFADTAFGNVREALRNHAFTFGAGGSCTGT